MSLRSQGMISGCLLYTKSTIQPPHRKDQEVLGIRILIMEVFMYFRITDFRDTYVVEVEFMDNGVLILDSLEGEYFVTHAHFWNELKAQPSSEREWVNLSQSYFQ